MTRDQLFILVMVAIVLLINFAVRLLRGRREREAPRGIEPETPRSPPPARRLPFPVVEPQRAREGLHSTLFPLETPPPTTRRRARSPLGSLQAVRRGIILMTILGPCRALEPPAPHA